ncbi:hypothetical protein AbraCBS73388_008479 [Aspergillus brasiliensis]|uniref:Uncharacterized protein n=1 Tax=Aspergillus brasiliensis TaxID=319629 RepID=A0A9W6DNX4_9EURO|nr:hypothetical protein AbraCBS73388_008479 [Aspergillus brasiliensis]
MNGMRNTVRDGSVCVSKPRVTGSNLGSGDIVRFGPNSLSFNTSKALSDIYAVRANVQKSDGYASMSPSRYTPNTLTAIFKNIHTFKRRILTQAFSDQSIKEMEGRIQENISSFLDILVSGTGSESGWSSPKNISEKCDWLAFDVITDLSYGNDLDMLNSPQMRWFPSVIRKISQRSLIFRLDVVLLTQKYTEIVAAARWTRSQAAARLQLGNNNEQKDIFGAMMNAKDKKTRLQFTRKDLGLESMLLLVAGSDTTATALSASLNYILHDTNTLAHLTSVIRTTFPTESSITATSVLSSPDCSVLHACINGAMRLTPPAPNLLPRTVLSGGMEVDGIYVPAGTIVGVSAYTIHRNRTYFSNPDENEPGRWLEGNEVSQQKMQMAFVPFSMGPRKCVAWRLAWAELNLAIARVLWRFDLRLAESARCCKEGLKCEYSFKAGVTTAVDGPMIEFRPRRDNDPRPFVFVWSPLNEGYSDDGFILLRHTSEGKLERVPVPDASLPHRDAVHVEYSFDLQQLEPGGSITYCHSLPRRYREQLEPGERYELVWPGTKIRLWDWKVPCDYVGSRLTPNPTQPDLILPGGPSVTFTYEQIESPAFIRGQSTPPLLPSDRV